MIILVVISGAAMIAGLGGNIYNRALIYLHLTALSIHCIYKI